MGNKPLTPFVSEEELKDKVVRERTMIILSLKYYYKDIKKRLTYLKSRGLHPAEYFLFHPENIQADPMETLKREQKFSEDYQILLARYEMDTLDPIFVVTGDTTHFRFRFGEFWDYVEQKVGKKPKKFAWWRRKKYVIGIEKDVVEKDTVKLLEFLTVRGFDGDDYEMSINL